MLEAVSGERFVFWVVSNADINSCMSILGSTVVYPYDDLTYPPIEVGASIFVSVNRILMRAVEHFGLGLVPWKDDEGDDRMGIWDGSAFLFITRGGVGWWDRAKILWRYGFFGPKRTLEAVAELTKTIGNVYNSTWMRQRGPWDRVEELNERLGFDVMTGKTAREYLVDDLQTGAKWADEMVEGSTRVNVSVGKAEVEIFRNADESQCGDQYAQDITDLHALVGMVSMAASGATSVLGGNRLIFQSFVEESKAVLKLNVEVRALCLISEDLRLIYSTPLRIVR
jgi:prenylcysteine oxidase/farnesylcysteine lyase